MRKAPYKDATLLVADRDLSKSVKFGFGGLSVNSVAGASQVLAIPICSYARQPDLDDYDWRGRWEEGHIVLRFSEGDDGLARQAVIAAHGFADISAKLPKIVDAKGNNSPAKVLASLLQKPTYAEKIALYSVGDQNRLSEIPPESKDARLLTDRLTYFLGYWLWDSLLRYPGVFANEIAAGSYLNLAPEEFAEGNVRALFAEALYSGPFADPKKPQWWRGVLDDIVAHEDCADGLELVRKKVNPSAKQSQCSVDASKTAGYYCIISHKPVSLEHSWESLLTSYAPGGIEMFEREEAEGDGVAAEGDEGMMPSSWRWESGNPAGFAGFPSGVGNLLLVFHAAAFPRPAQSSRLKCASYVGPLLRSDS